MRAKQVFGGAWTETKLSILEKYLRAYLKIFHNNELARYYETIYVDAFAGTGYRERKSPKTGQGNLSLSFSSLPEVDELAKGSVRRALDVQPGFDLYVFIEKSVARSNQLLLLKDEYPNQSEKIQVINGDANTILSDWIEQQDWQRSRALMFLDPFGMQIDWSLLERISATGAIDLWLLFPLGIGVSRMLTKTQRPPKIWADRLTRVLGTDEWQREFYPANRIATLFDEEERIVRDADFARLSQFFVGRLKELFPGVAENPAPFYNSRNVPMYLFCFVTANPKQSPRTTAIRIAQDVLKKIT